ncbi:hypothetical protein EJ06DRAFT_578561 [Trichodelitschia bisporula]|uniref:Uncharacterized protein n=1 Tax=Trichodelitschia bisporula TaxID=703511 RepID=A0A6G1IAZ7_9PEZI|nr:hypothetical protein EJ06DRAFT_578561 [Trichodelitschia bisporula]
MGTEAPTVVTVIGVNPTSSSKTSDITSDDAPVPKSRSDISAVGAGIGIPLVILAVAGAAYFCCWRRPKSKSTDFSTYTGSTTGPTQVVPTAASIPLNSLRSGHSSGPASQWGLGMSHSTTQVPTTAASVPRNSVRSGHSSGPASRRSGMSNSQSGRDIDPRDSRSPAPTEPTPYSP